MDAHRDWVISGMSGRFPGSENLDDFWDQLIQGKDTVSESNRSWDSNGYEVPTRMGSIPFLEKFDASFFGVSGTQANGMDPKIRIALEVVYEAIADAGLNPKTLDGDRVGVFMATSYSEASDIWLRSSEKPSAHCITGSHPTMLADRISYTFNFRGPSCFLDSGCSGSFNAMQYAMLALKNGLCDSAIVGGATIDLLPLLAQVYYSVNVLSADGKCKAFDADCDGYARSEAVVALYICRKDRARRSYATIVGVKCVNDGYKPESISAPSAEKQEQLMKELYAEAKINPLEVAYVEAHGTGTKVGDPKEIASLAAVFCNGRKEPLLVGSVKTNIGHTEAVSGICGIMKMLMSRRAGTIPPNLHFKNPNPECRALIDGRVRVVTDTTSFKGNIVGVNSFGIGGTSAHVILQFDDINSLPVIDCDSGNIVISSEAGKWETEKRFSAVVLPTLILASGRTKEAVEHFLNVALKNSNNMEFVGLLHNIARTNVPRHDFAGYALTKSNENFEIVNQKRLDSRNSIWYIYTGLGSQWLGMMNDMIQFRKFKSSIQDSSKFLRSIGVDLKSIIQTQDMHCLNNLQNAFVSIVACQVALTDLLKSLDIFPDSMIGHSLGEVTCGYADGCLSQEQAILVAFYRAKAFLDSNLPPGTMASVGLSWEEAQSRCPSDIFRAIHNAKYHTTVGGPKESILQFLKLLSSEGIFAKEVKSISHAFHTPYVRKSEHLMLNLLKDVIPEEKRRSNKWLSTSIPTNDWGSVLSKFCSAEYFVNNALTPVRLHEVVQKIPGNALVVEIGPHCFLQSVLKQSLKDTVVVTGLMHWKHDNSVYFLQSLGRMFLAGCHFNVSELYDPPMFPVSWRTPSISPLIKWDHSLIWDVPNHKNEISSNNGTKISISLLSDESLSGHVIQGKIIFPAAGYIRLVWKAFAKLQSVNPDDLPIHLENINFTQIRELLPNRDLEFKVSILKESGHFEIVEENEVVCTGIIQRANKTQQESLTRASIANSNGETLEQEDFYKLLNLKGYHYEGLFQGVRNIDVEGRWAKLLWKQNWTCFLDAMLQTRILDFDASRQHVLATVRLEAVTIDSNIFKANLCTHFSTVTVSHCKHLDAINCPGIRLSGLKPSTIPLYKNIINPTITVQKFIPYFDPSTVTVSKEEALEFFIGITVENCHAILDEPFIVTEILKCSESSFCQHLQSCLYLQFHCFEHRIVKAEETCSNITPMTSCQTFESITNLKELTHSHLVMTGNEDEISLCKDLIRDNGFLVLCTPYETISSNLAIVAKRRTENEFIFLLRKICPIPLNMIVISIDMPDYDWVEALKKTIKSAQDGTRVHILSQSAKSGILGFTKCLLKEPGCENVRCIHMSNSTSLNSETYSLHSNDILKKDLIFNAFKDDCWGSYGNLTKNDLGKTRISEHVYGNIQTVEDLSSLCWVESSCKLHQQELYEVNYASLNFRDIMFATCKLPRTALSQDIKRQECILGIEFSGTYKGKRVCGISSGKCLSSTIDHEPHMVWNVPDQWTLADAATVPVVYATVLYSLLIRGKLKEGESVLIHSGSGAVGLAAISIALDLNCKVFTTVGSDKKREFLLERFPQLEHGRILNSKNEIIFKDEILSQTNGRGVNLVLNSLAQEKRKASLQCLGKGGRFLEIGKVDAFSDTAMTLAILLKSVTIHGIHLDDIMVSEVDEKIQLKALVQTYIDQGKIKPLPFTCYNPEQLQDAFRNLSSRNHTGKVIIKVRDLSGTAQIAAIPRTYFYSRKTYIVIGGLGSMGLEIVTWMIERGAMKIFIVSRSGISTSYQKYMVKTWGDLGANVYLRNTNIAVKADVLTLMKEAISVGPLGGIFNLAIALHDALFVNQTARSFEFVSDCKATASLHFDDLSRIYAPHLDYFVVFSSITSGRGNFGQSNYGYANSIMERICEQRKIDGLPALAIQWGPVADVGSLGKKFLSRTIYEGISGQPISSCIDTLDLLLQQTETVVSSFLLPNRAATVNPSSKEVSLAESVAGILGIQNLENIDMNASMTELGLDSMMFENFKHAVYRTKNIILPASSYGDLTFKDLIGRE